MKEVAQSWKVTDMNGLIEALVEATELARGEGITADVVNLESEVALSLVRERLTDGSHVMNLSIAVKDTL